MSLLKRNTYQPQEVETIAEPKEGFAMVDFRDIDTVIENLTAAEMKLWLYLQKLDRYGDKMKDLPTPQEFAIRLGLSRRTVEKAASRLDDLGLYTFRVKAWQGANSSAARAHQTAKKMKTAKKEREAPEPIQDGRGYLAADAVNFSESGYLTESAANFSEKRLNKRDRPPQPAPSKDSATPQTNTDYSDLIKTTTNTAVVVAEENEPEEEEATEKPTDNQIAEAITEMQRISGAIKNNPTVRKTLLNYWVNFPAAREAVKTALEDGKLKNPTGFFISQLKSPPTASESSAIETRNFPPVPTDEQKEELATLGNVYERKIFDQRYPSVMCVHVKIGSDVILWWEALELNLDDLMQRT